MADVGRMTRPSNQSATYFWLSFCDPARAAGTQFVGAAIVRASHFLEAVDAAHAMGCNPGGEVMGEEFDAVFPVEFAREFVGKLLDEAAIDRMDAEMAR